MDLKHVECREQRIRIESMQRPNNRAKFQQRYHAPLPCTVGLEFGKSEIVMSYILPQQLLNWPDDKIFSSLCMAGCIMAPRFPTRF